jgi:transcription elongation factor Elf1
MNSERLNPCPFCGEKKHVTIIRYDGASYVQCQVCFAKGPQEQTHIVIDKSARDLWNDCCLLSRACLRDKRGGKDEV